MFITSLDVRGLRNLRPAELHFSPYLNLFVGANAAGKTSVLEALYLVARGRSFRTRQADKLIQHGETEFQLLVRLDRGDGRSVPVGLKRAQGQLQYRVDGKPVKRLSDLAALFPIQWLGGNLHTLIEDGPVYRRQFLDWGLFHVKPEYSIHWKRFHKLLKQRNAALRQRDPDRVVQAWNADMADVGERLDRYRRTYLQELLGALAAINPQFPTLETPVCVGYRRGWDEKRGYLYELRRHWEKDRERGFTRLGPQRAELTFSVDGKPAGEQLSRGQQKVFITALQLAQSTLLYQQTGKTSLFLLDDLGAELDSSNQQIILRLLGTMPAQAFITAIGDPAIPADLGGRIKRFHVKHGRVSEVV